MVMPVCADAIPRLPATQAALAINSRLVMPVITPCLQNMIKNILFWKPMPYPAGHRDEVRDKIVHSARRLFNRSGFDGVSVDQIMADAGLTRGGFYTYFKSKSELYAAVLQCFFTDPHWKNCWEGVHVD